jgi:hypothetical protein
MGAPSRIQKLMSGVPPLRGVVLPLGSAKASVPDRPMPNGWVGRHFAFANPSVQLTQGKNVDPLPYNLIKCKYLYIKNFTVS